MQHAIEIGSRIIACKLFTFCCPIEKLYSVTLEHVELTVTGPVHSFLHNEHDIDAVFSPGFSDSQRACAHYKFNIIG